MEIGQISRRKVKCVAFRDFRPIIYGLIFQFRCPSVKKSGTQKYLSLFSLFLFSLSLLFSVPFFTDSRERVGCTGLFDICVSAP